MRKNQDCLSNLKICTCFENEGPQACDNCGELNRGQAPVAVECINQWTPRGYGSASEFLFSDGSTALYCEAALLGGSQYQRDVSPSEGDTSRFHGLTAQKMERAGARFVSYL